MVKKMSPGSRKRNFYKAVLDDQEKLEVDSASAVNGVDDEIAVLRIRLKSILKNDPDNSGSIMQTFGMLARLININSKRGGERKISRKEALEKLMSEYSLPLGISKLSKKR